MKGNISKNADKNLNESSSLNLDYNEDTNKQDTSAYQKWSSENIITLIETFSEYIKIQQGYNPKNNRELYDKVIQTLELKQIFIPRESIVKKWMSLIDTYKKLKHRYAIHALNDDSGSFKITWDYFELMDKVFSNEFQENVENQVNSSLSKRLIPQVVPDLVQVPINDHNYGDTHSVSQIGAKCKIYSFKPINCKEKNIVRVKKPEPYPTTIPKNKTEKNDVINDDLKAELRSVNNITMQLRSEFNINIFEIRKQLQGLNENLLLVAKNIQKIVQKNK